MIYKMMDAYRQFARKHPIRFITINLILVVVWTAVIMGFSGENADVSGDRSAKILVGIVNVISPDSNVTLENYEACPDSFPFLQNSERVVRKAAHMTEYGLLAFLIFSFLFGFRDLERKYSYILPVIGVAALGTVDEINQTRVAGRYGSLFDVCVDVTAAVIAALIARHLTLRYRSRLLRQNMDPHV